VALDSFSVDEGVTEEKHIFGNGAHKKFIILTITRCSHCYGRNKLTKKK
jgi:hypothetical protein